MITLAGNDLSLGLGEWAVSEDQRMDLVCLGMGSCVAFVAHDPVARIGGMAHMVLPDSTAGRASTSAPAKFVDLAIPLVLSRMEEIGAVRGRLRIHLAGGAQMLQTSLALNIGERNVAAADKVLAALRFRLVTRDVGGTHGRTVRLSVATGALDIRLAVSNKGAVQAAA